MRTYAYGFPRIGKKREYKKAIESFWKGEISEEDLKGRIKDIENERIETYQRYVDRFPVGEITFYDTMLDTALMVGLYKCKNLKEYYNLCRGENALELTKWFNTNYHYLVPEISPSFAPDNFKLTQTSSCNYQYVQTGRYNLQVAGKENNPFYFIGPFTFLKLSKGIGKFREYLLSLGDIYSDLVKDIKEVHIDEPAFTMDLPLEEVNYIKETYKKICTQNKNIYLFTYYDSVDFLKELYELPLKGIGLDFINGKENLDSLRKYGFPKDKTLIAGVVNGRNIWKTNIREKIEFIKELSNYSNNIIISNASPLYHLPISIKWEKLDEKLTKRISFAEERLEELKTIADIFNNKREITEEMTFVPFGKDIAVQNRIKNLEDKDFRRNIAYDERSKKQKEILSLPLFPTTTIGSFPQTKEVRSMRARYRKGIISSSEYKKFIRKEIKNLIKLQEDTGLDVFVHGEFERTDMVEFFAEKLDGIATTKNGWVLSYGTRIYRPPIIYGDISRRKPMTVEEISFAQSLTKKPVKGMLTGPVTITAWSYVREDIPLSNVAYQIAFCLQDEISDYESKGIKIVQIDEPAFREKAPIKKRNWDNYFKWAVNSFNLIVSKAKPSTQIHTHMCYSEFGEIIEYILKMEFDVITIEASRSKGDIVEYFEKANFKRQIGPGVWDIHSPEVPTVENMEEIIRRALKVFQKENLWINPDCGLKTRDWKETIPSLKNLVYLAKRLREK